jgi:hypothetical protein
MTSPSTAETTRAPRTYRSPMHALVWSFRKSRDNWKRKYLDVKADLRRAHRRLDRLAKANRPSPSPAVVPSPALSANHAASAAVPSAARAARAEPESCLHPASASTAIPSACIALLHQALLDMRQQVQANREILEQTHQQNASLVDLAQQIHQIASNSRPLAPPPHAAPLLALPPLGPPSPSFSAQVRQPLSEVSHQAPREPKKGAPRQLNH